MSDADDTPESPDSQFLLGVELFNRGEFFEAHEVWEDLWRDGPPAERRFFQGLIQAAVAALHWSRGNAAGARRLYHSGRKYMDPYRPAHRGLAIDPFWDALAAHLAGALGGAGTAPPPRILLDVPRRS
jgi:predicted metal-dependent hydrolase